MCQWSMWPVSETRQRHQAKGILEGGMCAGHSLLFVRKGSAFRLLGEFFKWRCVCDVVGARVAWN